MIKGLCRFLFIMTLVTLFFGVAVAFLQYIAFFVKALGWDAQTTAGMWGGMLLLLTIQYIERKL